MTEQKTFTEEDLSKAVDQALDEILSEDKEEVVEITPEEPKAEEIEKAKAPKEVKEEAKEEDESEEEEMDEKEEKKEKKEKGKMKKSLDADEYDSLLKKAAEFDKLTKATEEKVDLKKALDKIEALQKDLESLKQAPQEKKSVDGLEVIQKANPEQPKAQDVMKRLTKAQVATVMTDDLIMKGVEGVSAQDVCEYEFTGRMSNEVALQKTLEAIAVRQKNGLL